MYMPIIACCCDKNYKIHLNVMLKSLDCNIKKDCKAEVYILYSGITKKDKYNFNESLNNLKLNWIKVDEEIFQSYKVDRHVTAAAYYRLLIQKLIPQNVDKIIYLDSDLVVMHDICELWNINIKGEYVGAVYEVIKESMYVSSPAGLPIYKKIGLNPNQRIFNTGVMIINLKKWREENVSEKAMDYLSKYRDEILWWDQDALNAIIAGRIYELNPQWNQLTQLLRLNNWKDSPYDKNKFKDVVKNPFIIHFNTENKPWQDNNNHKYKNKYYKYFSMIEKYYN
jgi:lipopolysaccharide biosynthesis glycosyltransferase